MSKKRLYDYLITVAISYTIICVFNSFIAFVTGHESVSSFNNIRILLWCSIGSGVLFTHNFFSSIPPLGMLIIQYVISMGLIYFTVYIENFFFDKHPDYIRDAFLSYTIPFIIGCLIYYFKVIKTVKSQNRILEGIRKKGSQNGS